MGNAAGLNNQGTNAVAIGAKAGQTNQPANSIVLNASGTTVNGSTQSAFYVNPIRNLIGSTSTSSNNCMLSYNPSTSEIIYNSAIYNNSNTLFAPTFTQTSDYRLKTNIEQLLPSRSIDDLKPVEYDLSGNLQHAMGFIAHEVQEIFPFLVHGDKDGESMQSLNYTGLIPVLVKEVQDLKKENKLFKERLEQLENKFNNLN